MAHKMCAEPVSSGVPSESAKGLHTRLDLGDNIATGWRGVVVELPPLLVYLASYLTVSAGVYTLFSRTDDLVTQGTKHSFAEALRNVAVQSDRPRWTHFFNRMFDSIFGERHLSWKCFARSCMASVTIICILFIAWAATDQVGFGRFLYWAKKPEVVLILLMPTLVSLGPDYLSLLKSRIILKRLNSTRHPFPLVLADLLISALVSIAAIIIGMVLLASLEDGRWQPEILAMSKDIVREAASFNTDQVDMPLGIYFYSTLFTSVWAIFFVLSGQIVRMAGRTADILSRFFNIEEKPFSSLGFVCVLLVTFLYILLAPVVMF